MIKVLKWTYECIPIDPARRLHAQAHSSSVRGRHARKMKAAAVALSIILCSTVALGEEPHRAADSHADKKPSEVSFAAEVLVLHATNSQKGIDARIGAMPELKKPPFSSYDSYQLLDRQKLTLDRQAPKTLPLPNGRVLETRLLDVLSSDTVRLSASINQPGGKEFLPLLEVKAKLGQSFIVAGQRHRAGILVLVIRVIG